MFGFNIYGDEENYHFGISPTCVLMVFIVPCYLISWTSGILLVFFIYVHGEGWDLNCLKENVLAVRLLSVVAGVSVFCPHCMYTLVLLCVCVVIFHGTPGHFISIK